MLHVKLECVGMYIEHFCFSKTKIENCAREYDMNQDL